MKVLLTSAFKRSAKKLHSNQLAFLKEAYRVYSRKPHNWGTKDG